MDLSQRAQGKLHQNMCIYFLQEKKINAPHLYKKIRGIQQEQFCFKKVGKGLGKHLLVKLFMTRSVCGSETMKW
jgi:hypothetical protein